MLFESKVTNKVLCACTTKSCLYYYLFPLELCYHDSLPDGNCIPLMTKGMERRFTI